MQQGLETAYKGLAGPARGCAALQRRRLSFAEVLQQASELLQGHSFCGLTQA